MLKLEECFFGSKIATAISEYISYLPNKLPQFCVKVAIGNRYLNFNQVIPL